MPSDNYTNLNVKAHHWSRILSEIESGKLVPVIGHELLEIEVEGRKTTFYQEVSAELIRRLGVEGGVQDSHDPLQDVIYAFRKLQGDPLDTDPYYQVQEIIESREWPIPESLKKLAEITHFDLFVSTTPDHLMTQALNQVRFGGDRQTRMLSYSPETDLFDLPDGYTRDSSSPPYVFKLLGDIGMKPDFAITEEDVLKFVHHLQVRDERPANLFDVLKSRSLALLGCSYENWLARFLFCSAKSEALFGSFGARGVIADQRSRNDEPLLPFLDRNRTLLYADGDSIAFVNELHERWLERFGGDGDDSPSGTAGDAPGAGKDGLPRETVFISYASEDREAALKLQGALEAQGLNTWLDKNEFEGGEDFKNVIQRNIEECVLFLPIISRNTTGIDKRFFRLEWSLAVEESRKWPDSYPFIQPIAIDETPVTSPDVPEEFRRRHWNHFPNGDVDPVFSRNLVKVLRRFQSRSGLF